MLRSAAAWCLAVPAVIDGPTSPTIPSDRVGRWQLDIDSFARQLTELHPNPFARIPRSRIESEIASLRAEVPSLSDAAVVVGLMRILALVGDSHTTIDRQSFTGFRQLPLRFKWFADGIFVIGATEEYRQALGLRLSPIGGAPVEAAIQALSEVIPYENDSWLRFSLVSILTIPEVLEVQNLVADASRVQLELEDAEGQPVEIEVPAMSRQALALLEAGPPDLRNPGSTRRGFFGSRRPTLPRWSRTFASKSDPRTTSRGEIRSSKRCSASWGARDSALPTISLFFERPPPFGFDNWAQLVEHRVVWPTDGFS